MQECHQSQASAGLMFKPTLTEESCGVEDRSIHNECSKDLLATLLSLNTIQSKQIASSTTVYTLAPGIQHRQTTNNTKNKKI
jgi:hypothetical protein